MRVLIGYDGSEPADRACGWVAGAAWPAGSEALVVTAFRLPLMGASAPGEIVDATTVQILFDAGRAAADRLASAAAARVQKAGLDSGSLAEAGRAVDVVLAAAETFKPDLLVVGHRGLGPFSSAVLGSVSAELIDHAPCPVLVARGTSLGRVMLADDGSPGALAAASLLTAWPIFRGSQVRVVSVSEFATRPVGPLTPGASEAALAAADRVVAEGRRAAQAVAQATTERLVGTGLAVDFEVRQGDSAAEIVAAAAAWPADLIVIGTRGRTGLARTVLGSVARKVLYHAGCSVLTTRPVGTPDLRHLPAAGG